VLLAGLVTSRHIPQRCQHQSLPTRLCCPAVTGCCRAGTGVLGNGSCPGLIPSLQNSLLAWGPLSAAALKADYQLLGWSGSSLGIYIQM